MIIPALPILAALLGVFGSALSAATLQSDGYHVRPGESVQDAMDLAAANASEKRVWVHEGIYRPTEPGQALIWFHREHDGIQVRARGTVILSGANPEIARAGERSFPALVNHVVYFGDGVGGRTLLSGFRITGANDYFSTNGAERVEPNGELEKGLFFFADGGGVKIFGRSYPVIEETIIEGNHANPCAGGVSVEHTGYGDGTSPRSVVLRNCVFRGNTAHVNGAALDLLLGSSVVLSNCLFVGNAGNLGFNYVTNPDLPPLFTNAAVLCVFPRARIQAIHCTFTGNRNGIHDMGHQSIYERCVVWGNDMPGGYYTTERYAFRMDRGGVVRDCWVGGALMDPRQVISRARNRIEPAEPGFDAQFIPRTPGYAGAGYRPWPGLRGTDVAGDGCDVLGLLTDQDRRKYEGEPVIGNGSGR